MKTYISPIMGTLRAIISIVWMGLCVLGLVCGLRGIGWVSEELDQNLAAAVDRLDGVNDLLREIMNVMDTAGGSLATLKQFTIDTSITLNDTRPLLDETSQVITQEVPEALDGIQESMPSVIEAAKGVDDTLAALSKFQFVIPNLFGEDWVIGLGIDYRPEVPLDEALQNLSNNLEGVPDEMRGMEDDLATADVNLAVMRDDLTGLAYDLYLMREQVDDINPQIEAIIDNMEATQTSIGETRERIPGVLDATRKGFISVMVLLTLSQIPSAYIGWLVARGEFDGKHHSAASSRNQSRTE